MGTWWGEKVVGGAPLRRTGTDDVEVMFPADVAPDYVRLPEKLGGSRERVLETRRNARCACGKHYSTLHVVDVLVEERRLCVSECPEHGFMWHGRLVDGEFGG